jgi:hypothetical protein
VRRCARLGQPERALGPGGRPHRCGHHDEQRQDGNGGEAGAQDGQVDLHSGAGLGEPGGPDRHQRGRRDGDPNREDRPGGRDDGHAGQRQHDQAGPGHAKAAQDRELRRAQGDLAAEQLCHQGQPDEAHERREDRQGDRFRADGPLGRRLIGRQVDHLDAPHPVPPGQSGCLVGEREGVRPGPQNHVGGAACGVERPRLRGAGERRAEQDPRFRELLGARHDLVAEDDDRRHPERQPGRVRDVGIVAPLRVPDQVQRAAEAHVGQVRQVLIDHDRVRVGRVEHAAGYDLDPVEGYTFATGGAGLGHDVRVRRCVRPGQGHLQEHRRRQRRHLRQAGNGLEIAAGPGKRRAHQQVRGVALAQEAGVGGVGAPGAGCGRQRDAADHAEQHGQGEPRPPLVAQLGPQAQPDRSHGRHSPFRPRRRSRMQASPPMGVLPADGAGRRRGRGRAGAVARAHAPRLRPLASRKHRLARPQGQPARA